MRIFATNRSGPSTPPIDPPTTYEAEAVALFAQFTKRIN